MILSDKDKAILKAHILTVKQDAHASAVELFKGNDFHAMNNNSFIRNNCEGVEIGNGLTIPEIQAEYDKFVANLGANKRIKSYTVNSYCAGDCDCCGDSEMSLDFVVYTLLPETHIEGMAESSFKFLVRDFEWKFVHQRNGKDVARHLKYFDRIGIDISQFN